MSSRRGAPHGPRRIDRGALKANLGRLAAAMEFEKGEQGAYPTDSATVSDFRDIEATYYDYELVPTDATTFEIRAMGKDTMKGDIWVVKPAGVPTAVTDLCQ